MHRKEALNEKKKFPFSLSPLKSFSSDESLSWGSSQKILCVYLHIKVHSFKMYTNGIRVCTLWFLAFLLKTFLRNAYISAKRDPSHSSGGLNNEVYIVYHNITDQSVIHLRTCTTFLFSFVITVLQ